VVRDNGARNDGADAGSANDSGVGADREDTGRVTPDEGKPDRVTPDQGTPDRGKPDRRQAIGDAAIGIVAREGLRSLTHRAIDRELDLPAGSTSYYARTRRQLIEAMVHRLANRTTADMGGDIRGGDIRGDYVWGGGAPLPAAPGSPAEAARTLAALLDRLAERPEDHRARFALVVDLADDPELHAHLTHASPVRAGFLAAATAMLGAIGVSDPERHAPALVALVDGLLFDRVAGSGLDPSSRPDAEEVIRAYLIGLTHGQPGRADVNWLA
jgi:AcrR family transcriptional regulator